MIPTGSPVPDVDVDTGAGGRSLRDEVGDVPTLLVFFKQSCPTCRIALPVYAPWTAYAPAVRLLGVSQDAPAETGRLFGDLGIDMPVVFDTPPYAASAAFDLESVPSLALVEDGVITWTGQGWQTATAADLAARLAGFAGREPILEGTEDLPVFKPG